jgi:uncharacterized protein YegP (UPF0339 family)
MMIKVHKTQGVKTGNNTYQQQFWYPVMSPNNKVLVTSETFTRKANCMKSIYSLLEVVRDERTMVVDMTK